MFRRFSKKTVRRVLALVLCIAVLTLTAVSVFGADAAEETRKAIDWGNGVTTDVVLEWAVTIGCCIAGIFIVSGRAVGLVLEKKKK